MKYVSGRVKELKVGLSSYSENKTSLIAIGNVNVSGSVTATTFFGDGSSLTGIAATDNVRTNSLVVSGISTFNDVIDSNGRIVGAATSNVIPFLYSNYSDLPSPVTYHGAFAHVHATQKAYFAHGGAWYELVNQESTGTVGTGTERYNIGPVDLTTLDVSGISTFAGEIDANGRIVGAATSNVIPFLYNNFSDLPSAGTYHGAFAHVHATQRAYFAHGGAWYQLVNQESTGTVGTGTERYNIGPVDLTTLDVSGISTFAGNVGVGTAVATDAVKSSNTTKVAAGIVTSYNIFSNRYHGDSAENFFAGTFAGSGDAGIAAGADNNIGIGRSALSVLSSGYRNIAFGCEAGLNVSSGRDNFLVGFEAGCDISTGIHNIAIGSQALLEGTAACYNIAIGIKAGRGNPSNPTDASACNKYITAVGGLAGDSQVAGHGNVYMGYSAFRGAYNAGGTNVTGNDNNIVIGCWAASSFGGCEITNNIVIGASAGRDAQNGPSTTLRENILLGACAGRELRGSCNIFLGSCAGKPVSGCTRGDKNIGIGQSVVMPKLIGSNQLAIGQGTNYWIVGNSSYNVGIGTTNPDATVNQGNTQKLAVGILTAYNIFSTREISVGENVKLGAAGVITATTFKGDVDAVNIDVDGRADIDDLIVTGVSTFFGLIDADGGVNVDGGLVADTAKISDLTNTRVVYAGVDGELQDSSNLTFDGTTLNGTFSGDGTALLVTIPGISTTTTSQFTNLNVTGIITAGSAILGSAKVSDLTDNRVVVAGTGGELEDSNNLTFDGSTLSIIGDATFTGNVTVGGTLTSEDKTNIDSIGIVTARTGVRINSGGLVVTAGVSTFSDAIDANNGANISGGAGLVAATAKISDLTSGRVVVTGTAGELEDSGSFTFSGGTVTATAFAGDGSALTGITASGLGAIGGLTIKDEGVVVGTAGSVSTIDFRGGLVNVIATAGAAGVATATIATESNPTLAMLNVTGVSTFQSAVGISSDLTLSSTDTGSSAGPILNLYRNSATPADADYLGQIKFQGESDTGVQRNYAKITGKILDASNTSEDGIIEFAHIKAGSQTITARFRSDSLQLLNGTNFSVDGTSTFNGTADFDGGLVTINPTGANHAQLTINSLESNASAGPIIKLDRSAGFFTNDEPLGEIRFTGRNSSSGSIDYVKITGRTTDKTAGTEDGKLQITNFKAGTATTIAEFRSDGLFIPNDSFLNVTGVSTFSKPVGITSDLQVTGTTKLDGTVSSNNSLIEVETDTFFSSTNGIRVTSSSSSDSQRLRLKGDGVSGRVESIRLQLNTHFDGASTQHALTAGHDSGTVIYHLGSQKFTTTSTGVVVTGIATATDFDSTSDIRLKTNIQAIEDPLAKVVQIEGVSFNWKEDNRPALGVIADQVEKIIPELVHGDNPKTVNYNGLIGLLIEAVKEQQVQITELKSKLDSLS